jgi:hypothetical protein
MGVSETIVIPHFVKIDQFFQTQTTAWWLLHLLLPSMKISRLTLSEKDRRWPDTFKTQGTPRTDFSHHFLASIQGNFREHSLCFTQPFSSSLNTLIRGALNANLDAHNEEHMCAAHFGRGTQGPDSIDSVRVSTWHPPFRMVKVFWKKKIVQHSPNLVG